MSDTLTSDEVNQIVADRLHRDRKKRQKEIDALKQQVVRYSSELQSMRDRVAHLDLERRAAERVAGTHQNTVKRRDQTISALRAQLTERGI